jgi:hypothetical protein
MAEDELISRSFSWARLHKLLRPDWTPLLLIGGVALLYWLKLPSDAWFLLLALFVLLGFRRIERRLDAVQLRLAHMHDRLDALAGIEPQHHIEAELDARP